MNGLINILGSDQLLRSDLSSVSFNLQRQSNDLVERERIIAPAHRESVTEDLKIKNKSFITSNQYDRIHRPPVVAKGKHKRTLTRKTTSIGPLQLATPSVPSSPRRKIRKHRVMSPMASPQFDLKQLPYSENQTPLHNNQSVEFKNDPEVNPTTNPLGFLPTDLFQFDTSSIPKKRPLSQNNSNAKNNPVDREKLQYLAELLQEREENIPPNRLRVKMKKPKSNENGNTMKETNEGKENSLPTKKEVKTKVIDPQPQLKPKHVDQEELKRLHAYMKQKKLLKKEKLLKEQEEEERKRRLIHERLKLIEDERKKQRSIQLATKQKIAEAEKEAKKLKESRKTESSVVPSQHSPTIQLIKSMNKEASVTPSTYGVSSKIRKVQLELTNDVKLETQREKNQNDNTSPAPDEKAQSSENNLNIVPSEILLAKSPIRPNLEMSNLISNLVVLEDLPRRTPDKVAGLDADVSLAIPNKNLIGPLNDPAFDNIKENRQNNNQLDPRLEQKLTELIQSHLQLETRLERISRKRQISLPDQSTIRPKTPPAQANTPFRSRKRSLQIEDEIGVGSLSSFQKKLQENLSKEDAAIKLQAFYHRYVKGRSFFKCISESDAPTIDRPMAVYHRSAAQYIPTASSIGSSPSKSEISHVSSRLSTPARPPSMSPNRNDGIKKSPESLSFVIPVIQDQYSIGNLFAKKYKDQLELTTSPKKTTPTILNKPNDVLEFKAPAINSKEKSEVLKTIKKSMPEIDSFFQDSVSSLSSDSLKLDDAISKEIDKVDYYSDDSFISLEDAVTPTPNSPRKPAEGNQINQFAEKKSITITDSIPKRPHIEEYSASFESISEKISKSSSRDEQSKSECTSQRAEIIDSSCSESMYKATDDSKSRKSPNRKCTSEPSSPYQIRSPPIGRRSSFTRRRKGLFSGSPDTMRKFLMGGVEDRLTPASLSRSLELGIQNLCALNEAHIQYTELGKNRAVAVCQQESMALAQLLLEQQRLHETDLINARNTRMQAHTTSHKATTPDVSDYEMSFESVSEIDVQPYTKLKTSKSSQLKKSISSIHDEDDYNYSGDEFNEVSDYEEIDYLNSKFNNGKTSSDTKFDEVKHLKDNQTFKSTIQLQSKYDDDDASILAFSNPRITTQIGNKPISSLSNPIISHSKETNSVRGSRVDYKQQEKDLPLYDTNLVEDSQSEISHQLPKWKQDLKNEILREREQRVSKTLKMTEKNTKNAWQEVETAERIISESHAQRAKRQIVLTDSEISESHSNTNMSEIQSVSKPTLKEVKSNLNVVSTKKNLKENNVNQSDSCDDESDHSNHSLSELLNNLYKAKQKLSINVLHQKERKIHQGKELIETLIEQSGRAKQLDEEQQRISNMLEAILEPFNMKKSIKDNKKEHLSTGNLADLNTNLKQYLIKSEVKVTDSKSALSPARIGRNHTSPERSNREDTDLKSRSVQESLVKSLKSLETNQSISSIEEDIPFHQSNASISEDLDFKTEDSVSDIGFNVGVNAPAIHKSSGTDSKMPIDNSAFEPPELIEEIIETLPEDIEEELEYYNTDSFENITSISEAITKPNSTKPKDKTNKESSHLENKIADLKIEVKSTKIADAKANQSSNINTVVPISVINQESKIKIAVLEPTTNETKITKSQILDDKGQSKRQLNQQNAATSLLEKKQLTEVAAVESLQNIQFSSQSDAQKLLVAQPISSDNHIGILSISAAKVESLPVDIPEDAEYLSLANQIAQIKLQNEQKKIQIDQMIKKRSEIHKEQTKAALDSLLEESKMLDKLLAAENQKIVDFQNEMKNYELMKAQELQFIQARIVDESSPAKLLSTRDVQNIPDMKPSTQRDQGGLFSNTVGMSGNIAVPKSYKNEDAVIPISESSIQKESLVEVQPTIVGDSENAKITEPLKGELPIATSHIPKPSPQPTISDETKDSVIVAPNSVTLSIPVDVDSKTVTQNTKSGTISVTSHIDLKESEQKLGVESEIEEDIKEEIEESISEIDELPLKVDGSLVKEAALHQSIVNATKPAVKDESHSLDQTIVNTTKEVKDEKPLEDGNVENQSSQTKSEDSLKNPIILNTIPAFKDEPLSLDQSIVNITKEEGKDETPLEFRNMETQISKTKSEDTTKSSIALKGPSITNSNDEIEEEIKEEIEETSDEDIKLDANIDPTASTVKAIETTVPNVGKDENKLDSHTKNQENPNAVDLIENKSIEVEQPKEKGLATEVPKEKIPTSNPTIPEHLIASEISEDLPDDYTDDFGSLSAISDGKPVVLDKKQEDSNSILRENITASDLKEPNLAIDIENSHLKSHTVDDFNRPVSDEMPRNDTEEPATTSIANDKETNPHDIKTADLENEIELKNKDRDVLHDSISPILSHNELDVPNVTTVKGAVEHEQVMKASKIPAHVIDRIETDLFAELFTDAFHDITDLRMQKLPLGGNEPGTKIVIEDSSILNPLGLSNIEPELPKKSTTLTESSIIVDGLISSELSTETDSQNRPSIVRKKNYAEEIEEENLKALDLIVDKLLSIIPINANHTQMPKLDLEAIGAIRGASQNTIKLIFNSIQESMEIQFENHRKFELADENKFLKQSFKPKPITTKKLLGQCRIQVEQWIKSSRKCPNTIDTVLSETVKSYGRSLCDITQDDAKLKRLLEQSIWDSLLDDTVTALIGLYD